MVDTDNKKINKQVIPKVRNAIKIKQYFLIHIFY